MVDDANEDLIEIISTEASAGYLNGYADPEYVEDLQKIKLPFLPAGKHRAFPIKGDSMLPTKSGAFVIAKFLEDIQEVKEGKTYIVLTQNDGLTYKRVYKKEENRLLLVPDNKKYNAYEVHLENVLELWEYTCCINTQEYDEHELKISNIALMLNQLGVELKALKKTDRLRYSIVDIETTGGDKITEISILIFDGEKVVDEFTSLVNPECSIPKYITSLTGIDDRMVRPAPKFYEIAKKILEITENTIFVAHSVNFDYNILQKEFKSLGARFQRKKLCTVRLSRKILPGLPSYSLGKLCTSLSIPLSNRHRAKGDADATVLLFGLLLARDTSDVIGSSLHPRSREATLPPLLPKDVIDNLPEREGVYYFRNSDNEVLYIGKAINIKKRVLSHIYDKSKREINLCLATANITYTETGSELLALLLESAEIKKTVPKIQQSTTENA